MDCDPSTQTRTQPTLTPELWSHVFSFCRQSRDLSEGLQPQPTLVAVMRVSSLKKQSFYHAAYPHLYSHVSVHNLSSFLYGSRPPSLFSSTSISSLAIKNDLLRCVRSLHVCSKAIKEEAEEFTSEGVIHSGEEGGQDPELSETRECVVIQADSLRRYICHLLEPCPTLDLPIFGAPRRKPLLLPNVVHLQYNRTEVDPEVTHTEHERMYMNEFYLAPAIAQLSSPKYWCEDEKSYGCGLSTTSNAPILSRDQLPSVYYNHFDALPDLVWGTNNVFYSVEQSSYLDRLWLSDVSEYIQELSTMLLSALERAWESQSSGDKDIRRRAAQATTLLVYGLVPAIMEKDPLTYGALSSLFGEEDGAVEDAEDIKEDHMRAENRAREEARRLMDKVEGNLSHEIEAMDDKDRMEPLKLVLKGAWEAEPCPCCGRTCQDV